MLGSSACSSLCGSRRWRPSFRCTGTQSLLLGCLAGALAACALLRAPTRRSELASGGVVRVSDPEWEVKRSIARATPDCAAGCTGPADAGWYQDNFEPNFSCGAEMRLGAWGDGGKWICNPLSLRGRECLVYSVGSENDFRFEEAVHGLLPHCEIHTFDHTVGPRPSRRPPYVHFHPWGLGPDGERPHVLSLASIVRRLKHVGRTIDIFKIDCEGCEFRLDFWATDLVELRQIQLEIHGNGKPPSVHLNGTLVPADYRVLRGIKRQHYATFHKEPNIKHNPSCVEYSFLKLDAAFWAAD